VASDRPTRLNWIVALVFAVGGALFAAGAWIAQVGSGDAVTIASVYLVGVFCFVGGAYGSLLLASNGAAGVDGRWRWWSYRPLEIGWVATFVLLCGALAFVVSVGSSLIGALSIPPQERLVWAPDMVGRILFLLAGALGVIAFHDRGSAWVQPRRRGWWIPTVNLLGAALFNVSGLSALVGLATASATNADISNWATFAGGIAFTLAGILQAFQRPVGDLVDAGAPLPL
jgi:hypothetical protein